MDKLGVSLCQRQWIQRVLTLETMTSDPRNSLTLLAVLAPRMATDSCHTEKMEPGTSGCQGTLTPNHFLHGQIWGQLAPTLVDSTQFNLRKRWRWIQELVGHFWQRWLRAWLPTLATQKMEPGTSGCQGRRYSTCGLARYIKGKFAIGKSFGGLPGNRRAS